MHRPFPWGLIVTFMELIHNSRYEFTKKEFIKSSSEIEELFETVLKSFDSQGVHPQQIASHQRQKE